MPILVNKNQALVLIVTNHNISETVFCFLVKVSPRLLSVIEGKISVTRSSWKRGSFTKGDQLEAKHVPQRKLKCAQWGIYCVFRSFILMT